jgi:hypothetical protein
MFSIYDLDGLSADVIPSRKSAITQQIAVSVLSLNVRLVLHEHVVGHLVIL